MTHDQKLFFHKLTAEHSWDLEQLDATISREPWPEQLFAKEFEHSFSLVLGVSLHSEIQEEKLLGFAVLHIVLDEARLVHFGVHPKFQGQGIGQAVMERLDAELAARDVENIFLEVRVGNEAARSLYKKLDFAQVGVRKAYYSDNGEDALILKKKVKQKVTPLIKKTK